VRVPDDAGCAVNQRTSALQIFSNGSAPGSVEFSPAQAVQPTTSTDAAWMNSVSTLRAKYGQNYSRVEISQSVLSNGDRVFLIQGVWRKEPNVVRGQGYLVRPGIAIPFRDALPVAPVAARANADRWLERIMLGLRVVGE
jgi:hypothetical protein